MLDVHIIILAREHQDFHRGVFVNQFLDQLEALLWLVREWRQTEVYQRNIRAIFQRRQLPVSSIPGLCRDHMIILSQHKAKTLGNQWIIIDKQ